MREEANCMRGQPTLQQPLQRFPRKSSKGRAGAELPASCCLLSWPWPSKRDDIEWGTPINVLLKLWHKLEIIIFFKEASPLYFLLHFSLLSLLIPSFSVNGFALVRLSAVRPLWPLYRYSSRVIFGLASLVLAIHVPPRTSDSMAEEEMESTEIDRSPPDTRRKRDREAGAPDYQGVRMRARGSGSPRSRSLVRRPRSGSVH
ncbi:hypothetical protein SAY86_027607 [Trapa natans]|uniref:Uncharacterized protein n=1 Tax=Trapa natans TaxID=22666 RepID=A0AAN7QJ33_TRANT|nr:hypothetical protein SAY86_027607 [Trapa natans]